MRKPHAGPHHAEPSRSRSKRPRDVFAGNWRRGATVADKDKEPEGPTDDHFDLTTMENVEDAYAAFLDLLLCGPAEVPWGGPAGGRQGCTNRTGTCCMDQRVAPRGGAQISFWRGEACASSQRCSVHQLKDSEGHSPHTGAGLWPVACGPLHCGLQQTIL